MFSHSVDYQNFVSAEILSLSLSPSLSPSAGVCSEDFESAVLTA